VGSVAAWAAGNWFSLVQSVGIIAGLWFTASGYRRDGSARKTSDLLALAHEHRELWSEAHRRPDLGRIFRSEVDLVASPITTAEQEFLNLVFVHFETGWQLARQGVATPLAVLSTDVSSFFRLPVVRAVWEETRWSRNPEFVTFVDRVLVPFDQWGSTTLPQARR
jgi:hypothetical protein